MLRAVLLGMLSVCSVVACKSRGDAAQAQPGVAAGKVIEVKGAVTVKSGDAARPLAAGESIEGDDTVITGPDGNVVIELAHNLVRWELGPNKQQKVRDSIAWKAAKTTGPTAAVDQDTAAAGRPAERSAAGTTATADTESTGAPPPPAAEAPASGAMPDNEAADRGAPAKLERKRESTRGDAAKTARPAAAAEPREEVAAAAPPAAQPVEAGATGNTRRGAAVIAKAAPAAESAPLGGIGSPGKGGATTTGAAGGGGGAAKSDGAIAGKREAVRVATPPATLVAQQQSALKKCLGGHKAEVKLTVIVSANKATIRLASGTPYGKELEACVKNVIDSISFGADGTVQTSIKP